MGFLMTVGIMTAAIAYLWKRWRKTEGVKTAATRFALVFLYAIIAGGSLEKIWLGYLATLLLSAPIPSRMFVNWGHQMPAGQRHEFYYISKGEQVYLLLQRHGIYLLLQRHGISKGEQVCPFITATRYFQGRAGVPFYYSDTVFPRASRCALLLQRHGISKGEQVCLLLQPLCCGCFLSGVAGDGTVVLGPDGGVSTGTSRCSDRHDRDGDRRQLVLPVTTTIFAGRDGVIVRYGGAVDYRPTSQAIEAETYGRQDTGNGSRQGWDERAVGAQVAEWPLAVADETGASVAHPARPLRRGVGG